MTDPSPEEDRAIRNLVARYCHAIAERDDDAWAATWAEDGVWHVLGRTAEGREAILALYRELVADVAWAFQNAHDGIVERDGAGATGRWQITEHVQWRNGRSGLNVGIYRDAYARGGDGAWRFARRDLHILYLGPPDLSAGPRNARGGGA